MSVRITRVTSESWSDWKGLFETGVRDDTGCTPHRGPRSQVHSPRVLSIGGDRTSRGLHSSWDESSTSREWVRPRSVVGTGLVGVRTVSHFSVPPDPVLRPSGTFWPLWATHCPHLRRSRHECLKSGSPLSTSSENLCTTKVREPKERFIQGRRRHLIRTKDVLYSLVTDVDSKSGVLFPQKQV